MTTDQKQLVTLVKTENTFGHLAVGAKQTTKHPGDQPRQDAVVRAFRMLSRAYPDENTMCWTLEEAE